MQFNVWLPQGGEPDKLDLTWGGSRRYTMSGLMGVDLLRTLISFLDCEFRINKETTYSLDRFWRFRNRRDSIYLGEPECDCCWPPCELSRENMRYLVIRLINLIHKGV